MLGSGGLLVVSSRSAAERPESENSKPSEVRSVGGIEGGPLFTNELSSSAGTTNSPTSQELFFKMMLSVLLVIALGAAAIYVSKKLLPKITNAPSKEIRILETAHLGPHKAVHLIKIGNQRFLIGSTNQSITTLADVTDALMDLPVREIENDVRI